MKSKTKSKWLWLGADFLLAIVLILLDQYTKNLALVHLKNQKEITVIPKVFVLEYLENRGSAFSMFQGQKLFLIAISVIFMAVMLYVLIRTPNTRRYLPLHLAVVGIIAGGAGNMLDRIRFGYVIDFFSFILIHFPVFNIADIFIVIATFGMAFLILFFYREDELTFMKISQNKNKGKGE